MSAPHRTKEFWLDAFRREGAAFRAAAGSERFDQPVPSCPKWVVRDLIGHLGGLYRWHRDHVVRGVTSRPETRPPAAPTDDAELLSWWDDAFTQLVDVLESIDEDTPAWNWSVQPHRAIFWHRRMAHETAIHRWDAQVSVGLPEPVTMPLAVDGIDEVLDTWLPAGKRRGPTDLKGVVRLDATDAETRWAVRIRGEGISLLDTDSWFDAEPDAQAAAIGTASDLLLVLYGRIPLNVLTIQGDPQLVMALRTG